MTADVAVDQDDVAGPDVLRIDRRLVFDHAQPGRADVQTVALATIDDLGVAGEEADVLALGALAHRGRDAVERLEFQSLFEDEPGAQELRAGSTHRQVVDRAVDRQRTDIAAGEEQRIHDEGIGRQRQPHAADLDHRAVVLLRGATASQLLTEDVVHEVLSQPSAAAVGQSDVRSFDHGPASFGYRVRGSASQGSLAAHRLPHTI